MLDREAIWRRVGMTAALIGFDLVEALASIPDYPGVDRDLVRRLLLLAEPAFCAAYHAAKR